MEERFLEEFADPACIKDKCRRPDMIGDAYQVIEFIKQEQEALVEEMIKLVIMNTEPSEQQKNIVKKLLELSKNKQII